jgi:hypothetical protein
VITSVSVATSAPTRGVEPFRVLAQDHVVDAHPVGEAERRRRPRVELDRAQALVELERDPQGELGRDLRPVGEADVGKAGRAVEDGVSRLADLEGLAGEVLPGPPVTAGARFHRLEREREPGRLGEAAEDLERLGHDLGADAVAADDRDPIVGHGLCARGTPWPRTEPPSDAGKKRTEAYAAYVGAC